MTEILRIIRGRSVFSQTPRCPLLPRPAPVWRLPLIWSHLDKTRKPLKLRRMSPRMPPACFIAAAKRAGQCARSAEARERHPFKGPVVTASCYKNSCGFEGCRRRKDRIPLLSVPSDPKPREEGAPGPVWELCAGSCLGPRGHLSMVGMPPLNSPAPSAPLSLWTPAPPTWPFISEQLRGCPRTPTPYLPSSQSSDLSHCVPLILQGPVHWVPAHNVPSERVSVGTFCLVPSLSEPHLFRSVLCPAPNK